MVNIASSTIGAGCVPLDAAVIFAHAPPLNRAGPRRDSEAPRAATARDHTAVPPPTGVSLDEPLVSALCTCVLGERDEWTAHDWPPRSVAELLRYSANGPGFPGGLDRRELSSLLEQGLAALDEVTFRISGQCFARVDAATRLRAVFHLESGQAGLSWRQAAAFMDAFLTLAAEAYLCDALEPNAPAAAARIV
ncbi:MAG TPA: hypothetical protein VML58_20415 [Burkholderiaceae bacterium]|nr:hypothetical protein [Burkholderiaceae bacterium]